MHSSAKPHTVKTEVVEDEEPTSVVNFTIMHNEEPTLIRLSRNNTVRSLELMIEKQLGIPLENQFIYGWPGSEPSHYSAVLSDLKLPNDILLQVAISGEVERFERKYEIHVLDEVNGELEPYVINFEGTKTVKDVKILFKGISGIPVDCQSWRGWNPEANDDTFLRDCNLDQPFHLLALNKVGNSSKSLSDNAQKKNNNLATLQETVSAGGPEVAIKDEDAPSTSPACTASQNGTNSTKPRSDEAITKSTKLLGGPKARKRPTQGAFIEAQNKRNDQQPRNKVANSTSGEKHMDTENDSVDAQPCSSAQSYMQQCNQKLFSRSNFNLHNQEVERKQHNGTESNASTPKKIKHESGSNGCSESPRKSSRTGLLDLDIKNEEKAIKIILQCLDPLTQLSLRRVSKTTKQWVTTRDSYSMLEEEKWKNFRLLITGNHGRTFESAVNMALPISKYVFDIRTEHFYNGSDIEAFTAYMSLLVKDLTLQKCFMFQFPPEFQMFQSFHNLEKLTINDLVIPQTSSSTPKQMCPSNLCNIKVLKLNYEILSPAGNVLRNPECWTFTWSMLQDCRSLLYLRLPKICEKRTNPVDNQFGIFAPLVDYIQLRRDDNRTLALLEYLDLKHFDDPESYYINRFVDLLCRCYSYDIKLKNINALVVQQVFDEDVEITDDQLKFCENIVSMINYGPFVENAPMRNLEKLSIDVIPSVTDYQSVGREFKDIFWPKLRVIKIKDTKRNDRTREVWCCWQVVQEDLYGLNGTFDRGSVEHIKIDSPKVPYFLSEGRLAKKFYNLKRLEIVSWFSQDNELVLNKRFYPVWKKLKLEYVRIENCPMLNDSTFIGDEDHYDESNPVFLNLVPTLKTLVLGLNGAKNITDLVFCKVFKHLELKTFVLKSSQPLNKRVCSRCRMGRSESISRNFLLIVGHLPRSAQADSKDLEEILDQCAKKGGFMVVCE